MNTEFTPPDPNDQEARITALLLGELSETEAQKVRAAIAVDPGLQQLHDRLSQTIGFLRTAMSDLQNAGATGPLNRTMSPNRREEMLRQLRAPQPTLAQPRKPFYQRIPWYVPMSLAAAFIALLVTFGITGVDTFRQGPVDEFAQIMEAKPTKEELAPFEEIERKSFDLGPDFKYQPFFIQTPREMWRSKKLAELRRRQAGSQIQANPPNPASLGVQPHDPTARGGLGEWSIKSETLPQATVTAAPSGAARSGGRQPQASSEPTVAGKLLTSSDTAPAQPPASFLGRELNRTELLKEKAAEASKGVRRDAYFFDQGSGTKPVAPAARPASQESLVGQREAGAAANGPVPALAPSEPAQSSANRGFGAFAGGLGGGGADARLSAAAGDRAAAVESLERKSDSDAKKESAVQLRQELAFKPKTAGALAITDSLSEQADVANGRALALGDQPVLGGRFNRQLASSKDAELKQQLEEQSLSRPSEQETLADKEQDRLQVFKKSVADESRQNAVASTALDLARRAPAQRPPPVVFQPEVATDENAFSTFSLNVSDVSYKLAQAALEKGTRPEPSGIRTEEFLNAFDYRDPEPGGSMPIAFHSERAQYPFAQNRDILRLSIKTAAQGREAGRPMNLVLLLDNSGSMERADRVRIIREALRVLAQQLRPQDTISVVTFARTARLWIDALPGARAGELVQKLSELTPDGGTNLEEAFKLAYSTAERHFLAGGINRVVLLTDGAANLGDVNPASLKARVEEWRRKGIALDCFGIGWEGLNDDLLETLSRNGDGRYGFVNTPEEASANFAAQLAGALHVAASDVKVQVEFNPQRVVAWRQIGYAKHQLTKEQFRDNTVDAAELGAAEAGNALYTVQINPSGTGNIGTVRARYRDTAAGIVREQEWQIPFTGAAESLQESSPAMKLAVTAAGFADWLAGSPFASEISPDKLLRVFQGVPSAFEPDQRPKQLEWMLRQAQSFSGK